jgi:hypothetical protein
MAKQQSKKGGGAKKIGRSARKPSHLKYNAHDVRTANKIKRIRQSCGEKFLHQWQAERFGKRK